MVVRGQVSLVGRLRRVAVVALLLQVLAGGANSAREEGGREEGERRGREGGGRGKGEGGGREGGGRGKGGGREGEDMKEERKNRGKEGQWVNVLYM